MAGGNHTEPPKEDIYSGVVSIESIRILFFLATLNHLQIWAADVGNAFLNARCREKVIIRAGPEFGPKYHGKDLIVHKSLYGLRTASSTFHSHLHLTLGKLGFKPTHPDSDLLIRDNGTHYEYIGTYVDDLIIASKDPQMIIDHLSVDYNLKGVGVPEYYLGGM